MTWQSLMVVATLALGAGCTTYVERPTYVPPPPPPVPTDSGDCWGFGQNGLPEWDGSQPYDTAPEAITKVAPRYPDPAREAGVDGTVMTKVLVCVDGTVAEVRIVQSIPMLDAAAVEAVRQWRYAAGTRAGRPIAMWVDVPVRFSLR